MLFAAAAAAAAATTACGRPDNGYTLLFLDRFPAARLGHVSWAPDPAHSRLVEFDGDLHVVKALVDPWLTSPVGVAPYPGGRLLVTERTGEGVVFDTTGKHVREWESPFPAASYATDGARIIAARSPFFVEFVAEDGSAPLLWELDTLGRRVHGIGITHIPEIRYLTQLANAGAVAVTGDRVYFAPLIRDEILRLDPMGSTVWRGSRGIIPAERDPEFMPGKSRRVAHALVNIAMAVGGPDGRIYVLGGADSAATTLRLDALNPETGEIVLSRPLGTATTAIAVNRKGQIRVLDPASLLAQSPTLGRELFAPPFALPDLSGKMVRLDDYHGQVTLINFWASWCAPCREEFPHMAELYRDYAEHGFAIAAISDDVSDSKMRGFVREFRPPFPILVGGGRMKAVYHYRGLPYSVLIDRNGRVIERIFGFGGDQEFRRLRETIARELDAGSAPGP
ncbi:MAG TPA: redoxin domain-containing protein [Gemmatimonadales bacterium]|nr:redoxin domain-containing protein [Gemmatimonadales bacterium]